MVIFEGAEGWEILSWTEEVESSISRGDKMMQWIDQLVGQEWQGSWSTRA